MVLPAKSWSSVKVDMIIGARTFQIGLPRSTTSYRSIAGSGLAIAGRASAFCSRQAPGADRQDDETAHGCLKLDDSGHSAQQ